MRILRSKGRLRAAWCALNAVVAGLGLCAINFSSILALMSWPGVTYDPLVAAASLATSIALATGIAPAALRKGEWGPSLFSGAFIGSGSLIAVLQAIGFVTWNTTAVLIWHPVPLLSAAALGSGLSAVGLRFLRPRGKWRDRLAAAGLLIVATMAQHLLAVLGLEVSGNMTAQASSAGILQQEMALTITVVTVLLAGGALALAVLDR